MNPPLDDGRPPDKFMVNPARDESFMQNSIDGLVLDSSSPVSSSKEVVKRPFLRKGSRMPVSQIPADPFTPVVKAIKNPPPSRPSNTSGLDPHDLDRVTELASSLPRPRVKSAPMERMPVPETSPDELESFLRDMSTSIVTVAEHVKGMSRVNTSARRSPLDDSFSGRTSVPRRSTRTAPEVGSSRRTTQRLDVSEDIEDEMKRKLKELDEQILKFKRENEYCKKLRLEREAALEEAQRIRERALVELEAAEKDINDQRSQIALERKRVHQDKDRGKSLVAQLRELSDENRELKERLEDTEKLMTDKVSKLKAEIVRLTASVSDLTKANRELESTASRTASLAVTNNDVTSSYTHADGRIDRVYVDGRREAVFPSGLQKTVWPDGSALVKFPNGDIKQTAASGVVVYTYAATGCVQTTQPDGTEILNFPSGQVEKHLPDGTKEIKFPTGAVRRIDASGRDLN